MFIFQFLNDKIDQNTNFAKLPSAKSFFWYNCKFWPSNLEKHLVCLFVSVSEIYHVIQEPSLFFNGENVGLNPVWTEGGGSQGEGKLTPFHEHDHLSLL